MIKQQNKPEVKKQVVQSKTDTRKKQVALNTEQNNRQINVSPVRPQSQKANPKAKILHNPNLKVNEKKLIDCKDDKEILRQQAKTAHVKPKQLTKPALAQQKPFISNIRPKSAMVMPKFEKMEPSEATELKQSVKQQRIQILKLEGEVRQLRKLNQQLLNENNDLKNQKPNKLQSKSVDDETKKSQKLGRSSRTNNIKEEKENPPKRHKPKSENNELELDQLKIKSDLQKEITDQQMEQFQNKTEQIKNKLEQNVIKTARDYMLEDARNEIAE